MSSHVFRDMSFSRTETYRAPIRQNYVIRGTEFRGQTGGRELIEGIHLTANAFVTTHLLKDLTATEYSGEISLGKLS